MKTKTNVVAVFATALFAHAAHAQTTLIVLQAPFLGCTTNAISWSVGGDNPGAVASVAPTAGRPMLAPVTLLKGFDECSAALFKTFATGIVLGPVTITDHDKKNNLTLTIQLQNARISKYLLGDADGNSGPAESIALTYERITISNPRNGSFCFDTLGGRACSPQ